MSVVISMKLPPNCRECDIEYDSYYCPLAGKETGDDRYDKRLDDCPIIAELPEKHGDLIERDALIKESLADGAYGYVDTKEICDAPTIIEAEGD